jgi:hypothetical protein
LVIPDSFRDFFTATVGVAGALIGLLFVAVSLAPRRLRDPATAPVAQAQASSALLVFTNTLTLGLLALLPRTGMGIGTLVIAALGLIYCVALARVAVARQAVDKPAARALLRIAILGFVLTGWEVWAGVQLLVHEHSTGGVYTLAATMIAALLFGISRAWELVGLQDSGVLRSLMILRNPDVAVPVQGPEDPATLELY